MHSRRSGKRFKPWILAEGGCLSFIVVIPTANSSAAGTGGTRPDAIEAAINYVDMPLRLDKADAVPHASRGYASRRRPVDFGTTRAPRGSTLLSPPRELFLDLARYSSLAARGYSFVPVGGRNAVNKAVKSRIADIEILLRTRSKVYLTFSDYVPVFRIPYVYFLPGAPVKLATVPFLSTTAQSQPTAGTCGFALA